MEDLAHLFIKQPRAQYTTDDLGPTTFALWRPGAYFSAPQRMLFERVDFTVQNMRGFNIHASFFYPKFLFDKQHDVVESIIPTQPTTNPHASDSSSQKIPVCFYLHGSGSSRVDCLADAAGILLRYNIGVVSLDFSACGHSEGDYSSLSYREPGDVQFVMDYLNLHYAHVISHYSIWGRSMGAVAAVRFAAMWNQENAAVLAASAALSANANGWSPSPPSSPLVPGVHDADTPPLRALILDSPFSNLWTLINHIVDTIETKAPKFLVAGFASVALKLIRSTIKANVPGFDIKLFEACTAARKCRDLHVLMVHGCDDDFVPPMQSRALYDAWGTSRYHDSAGIDSPAVHVAQLHNDVSNQSIATSIATVTHTHPSSPPTLTIPNFSPASSLSSACPSPSFSSPSPSLATQPLTFSPSLHDDLNKSLDELGWTNMSINVMRERGETEFNTWTHDQTTTTSATGEVAPSPSSHLPMPTSTSTSTSTSTKSLLERRNGAASTASQHHRRRFSQSGRSIIANAPLSPFLSAHSFPTQASSGVKHTLSVTLPSDASPMLLPQHKPVDRTSESGNVKHVTVMTFVDDEDADTDEIAVEAVPLDPSTLPPTPTSATPSVTITVDPTPRTTRPPPPSFVFKSNKGRFPVSEYLSSGAASVERVSASQPPVVTSHGHTTHGYRKQWLLMEGKHNDTRSIVCMDSIAAFLYDCVLDDSAKREYDQPLTVVPNHMSDQTTHTNTSHQARVFVCKRIKRSTEFDDEVRARLDKEGLSTIMDGQLTEAQIHAYNNVISEARQTAAYRLISHDQFLLILIHPSMGLTLVAPWSGVTVGHFWYTDLDQFHAIPQDKLFYFSLVADPDHAWAFWCEDADALVETVTRNLDELLISKTKGNQLHTNIRNTAVTLVTKESASLKHKHSGLFGDALFKKQVLVDVNKVVKQIYAALIDIILSRGENPLELQSTIEQIVLEVAFEITGTVHSMKEEEHLDKRPLNDQRMCCIVGEDGEDSSCTIM